MRWSALWWRNLGFSSWPLCCSFLTASFNRFGLGDIGNPKLCTIELAKRTFESERYGLAYLNESLGIESAIHHRAYSDALSASVVMEKSFENLPAYVKTTDDLLQFSVSSRKKRAVKSRQWAPSWRFLPDWLEQVRVSGKTGPSDLSEAEDSLSFPIRTS